MKVLDKIILFLLVIAALQLALSGLMVLFGIALIAALIVRPLESLGLIFVFLLIGLIQAYPVAGIVIGALLFLNWMVLRITERRCAKGSQPPFLLPTTREMGNPADASETH
jgi:hypothetical protein